jgi:hypothetical protein
VPYDTRAPKELLHHLPTLELRRPSVSAHPPGRGRGMRGSRLLDLRPPHYRCPAVPGLKTSARAILMALGSSVHPSGLTDLPTAGNANCSVACCSATLRQPAPSPVLRLLWLRTPLPNLPVRAPAADAFTKVLLCYSLLGTAVLHLLLVLPPRQPRSCSRRPLITAGHPVRSPVPSPSCTRPGFDTPPPHRPANCNCSTTARQFVSARPCRSRLREKP